MFVCQLLTVTEGVLYLPSTDQLSIGYQLYGVCTLKVPQIITLIRLMMIIFMLLTQTAIVLSSGSAVQDQHSISFQYYLPVM